ncbi:MAG: ATP synthase F1 subunit epsilon [Tannerella sp.]|jgi:F-type H+-transporting ATPase subunit epsilon|nr:ATP synthase F1 subunit epsilon [Tannerella sp.]
MSGNRIHIRIISPSGILYEGDIHHVSFPGQAGAFAVYPHHAPIISALTKGTIIYSETENDKKSVDIQSGFVEVSNNQITVCVEE